MLVFLALFFMFFLNYGLAMYICYPRTADFHVGIAPNFNSIQGAALELFELAFQGNAPPSPYPYPSLFALRVGTVHCQPFIISSRPLGLPRCPNTHSKPEPEPEPPSPTPDPQTTTARRVQATRSASSSMRT